VITEIVRDPDLTNNDEVYIVDIVLDTDGDGVFDGYEGIVDNCKSIANPDQLDLDNDDVGNPCDPDRDGDAVANTTDNCPDHNNPSQANFDGDALGDHCDDSDGDGFVDHVELYMGTAVMQPCGANAWPADFDDDGEITILDVLNMKAAFNSNVGDGNFDIRRDLNADSSVDILDVLSLRPVFGSLCA
jgi:hypothetical protein